MIGKVEGAVNGILGEDEDYAMVCTKDGELYAYGKSKLSQTGLESLNEVDKFTKIEGLVKIKKL